MIPANKVDCQPKYSQVCLDLRQWFIDGGTSDEEIWHPRFISAWPHCIHYKFDEVSPQNVEPNPGEQPKPVMAHGLDLSQRINVRGKFLFLGEEKFWIKGVTYGTFKPDESGELFPTQEVVKADFAAMHASGY